MRYAAILALALLSPAVAHAQGAVQQQGPVVAGHLPMWSGNGKLMDAGGSPGVGLAPTNTVTAGTRSTGLGVINSSTGFCNWSAYASAAYSALCWGFDGSGNGLITLGAVGGGNPVLKVSINGSTTEYPGNGQGNILGPVSTTVNEPVVWNNTAGTLVKDGLGVAIAHTGNFSVNGNTALTGSLSIGTTATVGQTLAVLGNVTLSSNLAVTGNTTLSGTLATTGNATLSGDLSVAGNTTLSGTTAIGGQITATGGTSQYLIDGHNYTVSVAGILMPRGAADNSCVGPAATIINYGAGNGAPAGGSYTAWNCLQNNGTYSWINSGIVRMALSDAGLVITPPTGSNGIGVVPSSGTGLAALVPTGAWATGLDLSGGTYTGTAVKLAATATGSAIQYDADNYTDLSGATTSGNYRVHAGGDIAAQFLLGRVQIGSATPTHLASGQTTAPALTSCGTSPDDTGATDSAGTVTMGTGTPTGCVITFNAAYTAAPHCTVTWQGTPLATQSYAVSTTAITLTQTATDSNKVDYVCVAQAGG